MRAYACRGIVLTAFLLVPGHLFCEEGQDPILRHDLLMARFYEDSDSGYRNRWEPSLPSMERRRHEREAKLNVYPEIHPAFPGVQRLVAGPIARVLESSNMNQSYAVAGPRCYMVATLRGAFIERGILWGDETGIWSQPHKILDGVLIEVAPAGTDDWITFNGATEAVNRFHSMELLQRIHGIDCLRRDFAAAEDFAFFHQVEFHNAGDRPREVRVRISFQSNIRPIWHLPWKVPHGADELEIIEEGRFRAKDRLIPDLETAFGVYLPEVAKHSFIDNANPYRPRGVVEFSLRIPPESRVTAHLCSVQWDKRKIAEAGITAVSDAAEYLGLLLPQTDRHYQRRVRQMDRKVFQGIAFDCPEEDLVDAYYAALYNVFSLSSDTRPYLRFPHLMTCPERGYQMLFGIDTFYASAGAVMAGMREIVRDTLNNHFHYAALTGNHAVHFYVDHFGRHQNRGSRAQETAQFIATVVDYIRMTGDTAWGREVFPALTELFEGVLALDQNGDGWPEGMTFPSLTEESGSSTKLSAAVRLIWAAGAMADLAQQLSQISPHERYAQLHQKLRAKFQDDWWCPSSERWAVGLLPVLGHPPERIHLDPIRVRSLHYPQTYGVADFDKGRMAMQHLAASAMDGMGGRRAPGVTVWQNSLMAIGAYRYRMPDLGMQLLRRAAWNPVRIDKMLGSFSTMNPPPCDPPHNDNKLFYSWSAGPFIEAIMRGLMGIEADASRGAIHFHPQLPDHWRYASVKRFPVGHAFIDFNFSDGTWTISHRSGSMPLRIFTGENTPYLVLNPDSSVSMNSPKPGEATMGTPFPAGLRVTPGKN